MHMTQEITKKTLTNTQKWLYSAGIWLLLVLIFAIFNVVIYVNKAAPGLPVSEAFAIGFEAFTSMVKLLVVLPALWIVSIYQLVTGSDSVFKGTELAMTAFLWATPYVFVPLSYWIMGKVSKK